MTNERAAAATSSNAVSHEPSAELRLAIAMNGGVSLAVWIGGVTEEILHMVRSSPGPSPSPTYQHVVGALDYKVVVDVISGASAGGINGGLLALAIARDIPSTHAVRQVWIKEGDLAELLQPATSTSTTSLLDGEYFYNRMKAAFRAIGSQGRRVDDTDIPPVTVRLTASMLSGTTTEYPGAAGTRVVDTDFRGVFEFTGEDLIAKPGEPHLATDRLSVAARSTASFPFAFDPSWVPLTGPAASAAGKPDMRAFVKPAPGNDSEGMWVVDGGALNNKPLDEALDQIFRQPAARSVRRALLYVVPDPGDDVNDPAGPTSRPPESADEVPSLVSVLLRSAVTLPRNQSLRTELEAIEKNNLVAGSYAELRWDLLKGSRTGLEDAAERFETSYRVNQSRRSAARAARTISQRLADTGRLAATHERIPMQAVEAALAEARNNHYPQPFFPEGNQPVSSHGEFSRRPGVFAVDADERPSEQFWGYGLTTAKRIASAPIDLAQELLRILPPDPAATELERAPDVEAIHDLIRQTHTHLSRIHTIDTDPSWIDECANRLASLDVTQDHALAQWAEDYFRHWRPDPAKLAEAEPEQSEPEEVEPEASDPEASEPHTTEEKPPEPHAKAFRLGEDPDAVLKETYFQRVGEAALGAAKVLVKLGEAVRAADAWAQSHGDAALPADRRAELSELQAILQGLNDGALQAVSRAQQSDGDTAAAAPGDAAAEQVLRQLLAVELIFNSTTADLQVPQKVELAQLSAFAACQLAPDRATPAAKLTGVELAHFAAFYRKSWRGNDYMWGRLDAAERLTTIAMSPDRLRQRFYQSSRDEVIAAFGPAITEAQVFGEPNHALTSELRLDWEEQLRHGTAVDHEIDELIAGNPVATFPELTRLIVRRRQYEILAEELPSIATELSLDSHEGAALSSQAETFLEFAKSQLDEADHQSLTTSKLRLGLAKCRIGEEELLDEADGDRFSTIAGQTVAVATTTMRSAVPWKTGKVALSWFRGAGLLTYFVTQLSLVRTNRSGMPSLILLALMAAGGLTYASVFVLDRGGLFLSGIGIFLVAVPLFVAARRARWWAAPIVLVAMFLPALVWVGLPELDGDDWYIRLFRERREAFTIISAIASFTLIGFIPGRRTSRQQTADIEISDA